MRSASAEEVLRLLGNREPPIRFVDCHLARVDISFRHFEAPVAFEGCRIASLFGMAAYFFAGLTIERCAVIDAHLSCGGHNRGESSISISDTSFDGFVDFADCWFEGPVLIQRCSFEAGFRRCSTAIVGGSTWKPDVLSSLRAR